MTSPHSLESPICQLEVAHALRHRKRLVPAVRGGLDERGAQRAVGALAGRDLLMVARDNWQAISRHPGRSVRCAHDGAVSLVDGFPPSSNWRAFGERWQLS